MPSQIWSLLLFELDQEPQPVSREDCCNMPPLTQSQRYVFLRQAVFILTAPVHLMFWMSFEENLPGKMQTI